jgi:hypothetical protein
MFVSRWIRSYAFPVTVAVALAAVLTGFAKAGSHGSTAVWYASSGHGSSHSHSYAVDVDDSDDASDGIRAYVFTRDNGHWNNGSGEESDWQEAREAQRDLEGPSLWVRRGDDRFLITDQKTLDRAAEIFKPQEELGHKQGELGRRQGELGRYQGEIGRLQGQIGRMEADIALRRARVAVYPPGDDDGDRASIAQDAQELHALQQRLGVMQSKLGAKQGELGAQQAELGREQARVAQDVRRQLGDLMSDAIASGKAKKL